MDRSGDSTENLTRFPWRCYHAPAHCLCVPPVVVPHLEPDALAEKEETVIAVNGLLQRGQEKGYLLSDELSGELRQQLLGLPEDRQQLEATFLERGIVLIERPRSILPRHVLLACQRRPDHGRDQRDHSSFA